MSLTNFSLPIQTVSNTDSQYYVAVQDITQGQTNKEIVSADLTWKNNSFLVDNVKVQVPTTTNVSSTFTTSSSPPINPKPDDTWYDTASDIIFRFIDDGDGTFQWVDVSSLSNFANTIPFTFFPSVDIEYLIVGGGGSGGRYGGGGAGGIVNGTIPLISGIPTNYSIVVGAGAQAMAASADTQGFNGSNSSITGSFGTIQPTTLVGLGGGGGGQTPPAGGAPGLPGGSGGGGPVVGTGLQPTQNPGVPNVNNRGFPGGSGGGTTSGGGGGGAGGVGSSSCVAPGGAGYTWPITGLIYGGGGGGGMRRACGPAAGGPGGGGAGGRFSPTGPFIASTPGTNGLGGGGGGAGGSPMASGAGGSGTVILAIPSGSYPYVTAAGAVVSNPPAAPGRTVLTYTAPNPSTPATYTFIGPPGCNPDTAEISVEYLAVGGGGGGGNGIQTNAFGGAGGGGGVVTGTLKLPLRNPSGVYAVTVGTGGFGGTAPNNTGVSGLTGNNSIITGNGVSGSINITALGGGYGSGWGIPVINPAGSGGSGGGIGSQPNLLATIGSGTQPAQPQTITLFNPGSNSVNAGRPGGSANAYTIGTGGAGGGGGAANVGTNGIASSGGPGGSGYLWPFTGGIYGAGGGGAGFSSGGISFGGGTGAGERYGIANTFHSGGIGNPGYGGGGGGGYGSAVTTQQGSGGPGGPGAVLFAYRSNTILYTGGCISTPALAPDYIVHTFTSPGTLTYSVAPATQFAINYLVVGGGGAGGSGLGNVDNGGGGGAGGMLYGTTLGTAGITYSISVGAGGAGSPLGLSTNDGNPSSLSAPGFTTVTAVGGGAGGGMLTLPATTRGGQPGASGGGAFGYGSPLIGTGTAGQGNPGGTSALGGSGPADNGAGGGGGAGTSGRGGSPYHGGCGGSGRIWPYTNSYYAGGGGGSNSQRPGSIGLGGVGGGGPGSWNNALIGRAGAPGLGGGGGGSNSATPGPSGLVAGFSGGPGSVTLIAPTSRGVTARGTIGLSYTGISGSASFTGTTQYLTVPNSTALNLSGQPFTIEGWIYPMGVYSTWNTIITKRGITAVNSAWEVGLAENTGYLYFWAGGSVFYSATTPTAHTWNHFAAVYDGANINLYLNGSRIFQDGITGPVDQANNVLIGTAASETVWQSFVGYMSNLRVTKANTRYTDVTYTIPTEPFTSDANTSLLTLQSGSSITDASNNAANISNYGPVTASFISPFSSANGTTVYDFTSPGTITFGEVGGPKVITPATVMQYLVVGGGGGGSKNGNFTVAMGGGGGAGGVVTGTITCGGGTVYTITVGAVGRPIGEAFSGGGNSGNNSVLASPGITTITALGGGGAGIGISPTTPVGVNASSGGSGGGGGGANPSSGFGPIGVTFASATGSPSPISYGVAGPQGYPGGRGNATPPPAVNAGGGGGGATGAGITGAPTVGGNGGTAFLWPYTGLYYAGGGGAGGNNGESGTAVSVGLGGGVGTSNPASGGGGDGGLGASTPSCATAGTFGRGGGGGGAGYGSGRAAIGGAGTVILAIPTPVYPGIAPGATVTTPPAAPGMTVLTYLAAGNFANGTHTFTT